MDKKLPYTRYSNPIRIDNQNEILKLKLNKEDRFLIKNQEPLAAIWRGNNESSCFYAWISSTSNNIIESKELEEMNQLLQKEIDPTKMLEEVISPLLGIIESGWYQLFYHEPFPCESDKYNNANIHFLSYPQVYSIWNHPIQYDKKSDVWIDETLVFTQDVTALNEKRVEHYKKCILLGERPTIVTMALAELEFHTTQDYLEKLNNPRRAQLALEFGSDCIYPQLIIDGHHKAKAYMDLNTRPSIINITKLHLKEDFENNKWNFIKIAEIIENRIGEKLYETKTE